MLSRYGTDNIIVMLLAGAIMLFLGYYFDNKFYSFPLYLLGGILVLFTLWFFRDPDRLVPEAAKNDPSIIISPADGKVVEIIEEQEPHYIKDKVIRISIFLSPLDVHVNRSPVSGKVEFYHYNPGQYLVAYHPKSSDLNEQSRIGVQTKYGKVFFKQIVGIVARRLVCELKVGDSVDVGDRFGMMKFGSRMDVMVSPDSEICVKVGDRVSAGLSTIAKLKK